MSDTVKTKEQVLLEAHPDPSYATPPYLNYDTAYRAMDEYAKQEERIGAIAFKKFYSEFMNDPEMWGEKERDDFTDDEIYNLYKENQSKK